MFCPMRLEICCATPANCFAVKHAQIVCACECRYGTHVLKTDQAGLYSFMCLLFFLQIGFWLLSGLPLGVQCGKDVMFLR